MKDFLGIELNIGDRCVFEKNTRTGSSTIRKVKYVGIIKDFTKEKVIFELNDTLSLYETDKKDCLVFPEDVIKIENNDAKIRKQERKRVCEEIRKWIKNNVNYYSFINEDVYTIEKAYNQALKEMEELLDQIKGEDNE